MKGGAAVMADGTLAEIERGSIENPGTWTESVVFDGRAGGRQYWNPGRKQGRPVGHLEMQLGDIHRSNVGHWTEPGFIMWREGGNIESRNHGKTP